jgi:hypothetical protein
MVTGHETVTIQIVAESCDYCHQHAYCAQCNSNEVLPAGPAGDGRTSPVGEPLAPQLPP